MSKKVKVNYVRWELAPVYNEVYIDKKQIVDILEYKGYVIQDWIIQPL